MTPFLVMMPFRIGCERDRALTYGEDKDDDGNNRLITLYVVGSK